MLKPRSKFSKNFMNQPREVAAAQKRKKERKERKKEKSYRTHQEGVKLAVPIVRSIPVKIVPFTDNSPGIGWYTPLPLCSSWKLANWGVPGT